MDVIEEETIARQDLTEETKRLIKLYSHVGDLILDPFAGVLTTSLAAAQVGRNSVCIEISKRYRDAGYKRFCNHIKKADPIFGKSTIEKIDHATN